MTRTSGSGTMNRPPRSRYAALALDELVEEVPGQNEVVVGPHRSRLLLADDRDPRRIVSEPHLSGLRSAAYGDHARSRPAY